MRRHRRAHGAMTARDAPYACRYFYRRWRVRRDARDARPDAPCATHATVLIHHVNRVHVMISADIFFAAAMPRYHQPRSDIIALPTLPALSRLPAFEK